MTHQSPACNRLPLLHFTMFIGILLGLFFCAATQIYTRFTSPLQQPWSYIQSIFLFAGLFLAILLIHSRYKNKTWAYKSYFLYSLIVGFILSIIYLLYIYWYATSFDRQMTERCQQLLSEQASLQTEPIETLQTLSSPKILAFSAWLLALLWTIPCAAINALLLQWSKRICNPTKE